MSRTYLDVAVANLQFARQYTCGLLEDVRDADWFQMPSPATTHLAWQMGHLAMAEYALTMVRLRGKEPEDAQLLDKRFFRAFQKGTVPSANASDYPPIEQIRQTFDQVHQRAISELAAYQDSDLQDSLPAPYALFPNKLGSVFFCGDHEMLHAGQIGLLRRLLGKPPIR